MFLTDGIYISCSVKLESDIYGGPQLSDQIQITHIKYKILTSNTNYSHQKQIAHIKYKLLTSNTKSWHQIQITHIKYKLLTSNTNCSHQIQIAHIKNKIKRSAVGERKLCPVFNLVPRAFPIEIGRGGKRPWHRLVTWSVINISWALIYATAMQPLLNPPLLLVVGIPRKNAKSHKWPFLC